MNRSHLQKHWKLLGLAVAGCFTFVPSPQLAAAEDLPPVTIEEAHSFLALDAVQEVCKQPISLSVTNATLDDIAARVQKTLSASKLAPKLRVQVRNTRPVRLSFTAKKSTIGEVLNSTATLASAQLWIFSDYLLLAPKDALLPAELESIQKGLALGTTGLTTGNRAIFEVRQRRAFSSTVADEIKKIGTPNGKTTDVTLAQLSPDSQDMVQGLFALNKASLAVPQSPANPNKSKLPQFTLSSETSVQISSFDNGRLNILFQGPNDSTWKMDWSLDGRSWGFGGGGNPPKTPSTQVSPLGDLSAGKS